MKIRMDSLIKAIATALDLVEHDLLGASINHGKRIAVLCARMGHVLGKTPEEITSLANCALLHDNALTESVFAEMNGQSNNSDMRKHCEYGERNVGMLGFKTNVKNFILYHHEHADGTGPFGVRAGEGPVEAELIAIADSIDVSYHLQTITQEDLAAVRSKIAEETEKKYSKTSAEAMLKILDWPTILSLKDNAIRETIETAFAPWVVDIEEDAVLGQADFIAKIIDYKSAFTRRHSTQIASKAWFMGTYYKYDKVQQAQLYLAAAFHDIGKLGIPSEILEKPGKLTNEEFEIIKSHARLTWEILKDIDGLEFMCDWASNHHEKLSGDGYSFAKKADELDFNSRLMACIDVYQAVSEERPYHPARNHKDTMEILHKMADNGALDGKIANDISIAFAPYDGKDLPLK